VPRRAALFKRGNAPKSDGDLDRQTGIPKFISAQNLWFLKGGPRPSSVSLRRGYCATSNGCNVAELQARIALQMLAHRRSGCPDFLSRELLSIRRRCLMQMPNKELYE
jgi:hypothetical protein